MNFKRLIFIYSVFSFCFLCILIKAFNLKFLPSDKLVRLKKIQFGKQFLIQPHRGEIVDRKGKELAISFPSYSLYADPLLIKNPRKLSQKIAPLLGKNTSLILNKIRNKKKRFVWIKRQIPISSYRKIKELKLEGIGFIKEAKRFYPHHSLLSQTLGFVGIDGKGLEGLELEYNAVLKGESKKIQIQKDARGRPLIRESGLFLKQALGARIELSIDLDLQYELEKRLKEALKEHKAKRAMGLILDAQNSEILALSSLPSFNPNQASKSKIYQRRNKVITDALEPGSTLKTFIIASALKDSISPNKKFYCEKGSYQLGPYVIRESDPKHQYEWLNLNQILSLSSNIGTSKVALQLGDKKVRKTLKEFGFGEKSYVDFPGESTGILRPTPWKDHFLGVVSFGHGIAVTPLQLAVAYASIANGGLLKTPQLIRSITDKQEGGKYEFKTEVVRRVLSPKQAHLLKLMLISATSSQGTGINSRVPGFLVAGKTGTAKKVNKEEGGYYQDKYISSFIGFFPVDQPKIVIYVAIDEPQKTYYGSQVAAPVFQKMIFYYMKKKSLIPLFVKKEQFNFIKKQNESFKTKLERPKGPLKKMPLVKNLSLRDFLKTIRGKKVNLEIQGSGHINHSWPYFGEKIKNSSIKVNLQ